MTETSISWSFRDANEGDMAFIYNSWLESFYDNSPLGDMPKSFFIKNYRNVIDNILITNDIKMEIACKTDEPHVIFGYCIADEYSAPPALHYVYVKELMRNFGVAASLLSRIKTFQPGEKIFCTHRTEIGKKILKKYSDIIYNPFLLYADTFGTRGQ